MLQLSAATLPIPYIIIATPLSNPMQQWPALCHFLLNGKKHGNKGTNAKN